MRSLNPSHLVLAAAVLLAVTGCSKSPDSAPDTASEAADASRVNGGAKSAAPPALQREAAADAAGASSNETEVPDIGQGAAPGVAFTYRYAFTLPGEAVAGVQQRHAAACERLGPARCQVTGMSYDQPRKGVVSARLDLLLAPEIAHSFGSDAISAVEKADGSVDTASLAGDNAGGAIEDSQRRSGALRAQLARIERRLATPGLSTEEKSELAQRASELRGQLGSEVEVRQQKELSLATTPMSFAYASEGMFSTSNPFGQAASNSLGSMQAMAAFLLTAAGLLLPWLLLGALVVLLIRFRAMKQRLARATGSAADSAPPQ